MTLFDYLVLGIVGASVLLGLWRGVVSELLALAAWVLAFFAARMFGTTVAAWLSHSVADPLVRQGVGSDRLVEAHGWHVALRAGGGGVRG